MRDTHNNMKQLKRIMAFVLSAAILLSMVYFAPAEHVHAAAESYIATSYASNLSVKTTNTVNLMQYPSASSTAKYTLPANTTLTVKALHKNTSGSYWYEVLYYNMTLYIDATETTLVDHLTGDVTIDNVMSPASLAYGQSFGIKGDISSTLNDLGTISATMHPNTNITVAPALSASDNANGKSYSLAGSSIDNQLAFGSMDPGIYTYVVTAEAISYYIDDNDKFATSTQTVVLNTQQCVITDWRNPNDDLAFGIDVSVWQGSIDWSQVQYDVDFAILRIGFATTLDNRFLEYAAGCEKYNIPYGVYLYSYALTATEAKAEAEFVINTLRTYGYNPELYIWFDMEDGTQASLGSSAKESLVTTFCDTIAAAGYQPGFYGFTNWFNSSFQNSYLSSIPVWIAQIDGFSSNGTATHDGGTWLWQYSWEGSISGIAGDVDCNICYFEYPGLNSDTSYLSKCTYYPARALATTNGDVNLRQYPNSSYTSYGLVNSGTAVEITGLYKNASGEYWYEVTTSSGSGYMHANYITIDKMLYDDLAVIDPDMASNLNVGGGYYLSGSLVSQYNTIYTTHAKVYSGEDTLADPVISSKYTNNSKDYDLRRSAVCNNLLFGSLSTGYYTYEISADVRNYYVNSGSLTYETENVVVWTAPFTVGNASIEPPASVACDHNIVTDAAVAAGCTTTGLTEGSHCTKCGVVFTKQTVIPATGHSYTVTSDAANCKEYELFHYTCSKCGDKYDISADELANWSETKPQGVPASAIETKTQYRYADCTSYTWVPSATSTIYYVNSWPSGFSTSNSLYSKYNNKSSKVTATETATSKTVINSDKLAGYLYYHWCYSNSYYSLSYQSGSYSTFHAYYDTTNPSNFTCDTSDMSYQTAHSTCSNSEWFFVAEVYAQNYTTHTKVKDGKEWGAWSAWSDTAYTAVENTRKVETRTLYRYTGAELGDHVWKNGACSVCGTACAHLWVNGVCNTCGLKCSHNWSNGKCSICNSTCSHNYKTTVTAPSCTASGFTTYTCTSCGHSYKSDYTGATGHSFINGSCSVCGTPCTHNYVNGVCSICGHTTLVPTITATGATLALEGEVHYSIYFTTEDMNVSLSNMGLLIWTTPRTNPTIENAEEIVAGVQNVNNTFIARSNGIAAKKLGDTVYLRVYAKLDDGSYVYSKTITYSAKKYTDYTLAYRNDDPELQRLVVALMNYGAAAQTAFSYKPYDLMNAHLTANHQSTQVAYNKNLLPSSAQPDANKTKYFIRSSAFNYRSASMVLEGALSITYRFIPSNTPDNGLTLYYWTESTYNSVDALTPANSDGRKIMIPDSQGYYTASYDGLAAKQMGETIYVVAIYEAGGIQHTTGVIAYSLSTYCNYVATNNLANKDVAQAAVVYGYFAKEYFTK